MKIVNRNENHEPRLDAEGRLEIAKSTEEHLLIEKAIPSKKRYKILLDALNQADLDNPVVFVSAYEALMGFYDLIED